MGTRNIVNWGASKEPLLKGSIWSVPWLKCGKIPKGEGGGVWKGVDKTQNRGDPVSILPFGGKRPAGERGIRKQVTKLGANCHGSGA